MSVKSKEVKERVNSKRKVSFKTDDLKKKKNSESTLKGKKSHCLMMYLPTFLLALEELDEEELEEVKL